MRSHSSFIVACIVCSLLLGCAVARRHPEGLYGELGRQPGLEALVDAFLNVLSEDERIVGRFEDTNIDRLRRLLIEQFCSLSGGPCEYSGDEMHIVHRGMDLTEAEFNALVEDLIDAMVAVELPVPTQNRLLATLVPLRKDIIHR